MASLTENTSRIANAKEDIKTKLKAHGCVIEESEKIEEYASKIENLLNVSNESQIVYLFKNGRFLTQFDKVVNLWDGAILDSTGMFFNICLFDTTYRIFDFQGINFSQCTNFHDCFTGDVDWWTVRGEILNFDMSKAERCNYIFNNCTYLKRFTLKEGASFGGNSNVDSLTIDFTQSGLELDAFVEFLNSLSANNSGYSRTFKIKTEIYDNLTDDVFDDADSKNYTIAC